MDNVTQTRTRALSHAEYIENLQPPSPEEFRRISEIQVNREREINGKYHTGEEHDAATKIQKAYRGHRARRELRGFTLDPSARWTELIREWRYQSAAAPQYGPGSARIGNDGRPRAASDVAKLNWRRLAQIAEHAGAGEMQEHESTDALAESRKIVPTVSTAEPCSMVMDMRYFLEMIDQKHRYGSNLMVYHEEWLRAKTDQNFFHWLDRGDGRHLSLQGCGREKLDRERVRYLSKDERKDYLVRIDDEGRLRWNRNDELITTSADQFKDSMSGIVAKDRADTLTFQDKSVMDKLAESRHLVRQFVRTKSGLEGSPGDSDTDSSSDGHDNDPNMSVEHHRARKAKKNVQKKLHVSPATILNHLMRASIKPGTWIYVADTVGRLYVGIKASGSFQHASFLSGARISSAGSIGIEQGRLVYLAPLSGHYRPTTKSFRAFLDSLDNQGVDLSQLRVSKALDALEALEYYTRKRKEVHDAVHRRERSKSGADKERTSSAISKQRENSESPRREAGPKHMSEDEIKDRPRVGEKRGSLARLTSHLHIHRKSEDVREELEES